jgi:hypothetical protein
MSNSYSNKGNNKSAGVKGYYSAWLMCNVLSCTYNFLDSELIIYLEEGNNCDMTGAINYATRMDPGVKVIQTFSGTVPDMNYVKTNGNWEAVEFVFKHPS